MKVIVFGAGVFGRKYVSECPSEFEIVSICDNNWKNLRGGVNGHRINSPDIISELEFDRIIVACDCQNSKGINMLFEIKKQLLKGGISESKIMAMNANSGEECKLSYPRVEFLRSFSRSIKHGFGAVAECGVLYGDFAAHINECFPTRKLFLFDSFKGWKKELLESESPELRDELLNVANFEVRNIDPEIAYLKMPYKENVVIKQGYVPDTLYEFENEKFIFVNLDMDSYQPVISALNFFANKMLEDGIILVHDQAGKYTGAIRAVQEFCDNRKVVCLPIGDRESVAINIL